MLGMKDKKKTGKPGRPATGRTPVFSLHVGIKPALGEALEAYVASIVPKTTLRAVTEMFLEESLRKIGFWPPPEEKEGQ